MIGMSYVSFLYDTREQFFIITRFWFADSISSIILFKIHSYTF